MSSIVNNIVQWLGYCTVLNVFGHFHYYFKWVLCLDIVYVNTLTKRNNMQKKMNKVKIISTKNVSRKHQYNCDIYFQYNIVFFFEINILFYLYTRIFCPFECINSTTEISLYDLILYSRFFHT